MSEANQWFIVKQKDGQCVIAPVISTDKPDDNAAESESSDPLKTIEQWGPFASQAEAIARRVGLIRAGKCRPV